MAARNETYYKEDNPEEEEEDEIMKELERDDDHLMDKLREKRLVLLQREFAKRKEEQSKKYGTYDTIRNEKELMLLTTNTEKMIIHFAHKDFKRCAIMDKHFEILSKKHHQTRWVKVDVENVPFLVERMEIKILPCIVMFLNGIGVDRLLGFEGVSEGDNFSTFTLEKRIAQAKVIDLEPVNTSIFRFKEDKKDEENDDWDD